MNHQEIPAELTTTQAFVRLGWAPSGHCYCGCGNRTNGHFAHAHDPKFPFSLLRATRGIQEVSEAIQRISNADDPGRPIPDVYQRAENLPDELRLNWGFQPNPNHQCYCGCLGDTNSYFVGRGISRHMSHFGAGLLIELQGNHEVQQAIGRLAHQDEGHDELPEIVEPDRGADDQAAAMFAEAAAALNEAAEALHQAAGALERAADRLAPVAE